MPAWAIIAVPVVGVLLVFVVTWDDGERGGGEEEGMGVPRTRLNCMPFPSC